MVISIRLSGASENRLKRMARCHGWTQSEAGARLVEEGLRLSEFAFIDFRDSAAGRQAYLQGSSLAVWEIIQLVQSYEGDSKAVAKHLGWPEVRVKAAVNYAEAFPDEIEDVLKENETASFTVIKRMLPQAVEFVASVGQKRRIPAPE